MLLPASTSATVAASLATVAAAIALIYARWILREAHATTIAQGQTVTAMGTLTGRVESSIMHLQLIVAETQALRELDQLTRIAGQVAAIIPLLGRVKDAVLIKQVAPHTAPSYRTVQWELAEQQRLLATLIAGVSLDLPKCLEIANDVAATSSPQDVHVLKAAMATARRRLADAAAKAAQA